jgi:toxin YhaV
VNGWTLFAHPLFLEQVESLIQEVESEIAKGKQGTPRQKVLEGIHRYAFHEIPNDPSDPQFRQGNTLGPEYRHWFRASFGRGRFRLFFRYQSEARIIVFAWINDENTLRTRGSRNDAYAVFRHMLEDGNPPDSWEALLSAATQRSAVNRLTRMDRKAK